ncbi:1201_t:CDS:2 [Funneliformis caledonium]|uniref:1201_t:CDS:1 n=1 Tax=Funneliformis caledonium TaxID=1117310 RepID=A0A9N9BB20_9GLOM|nr:1201_t:CDS:2 [Funneliformis caledonium]
MSFLRRKQDNQHNSKVQIKVNSNKGKGKQVETANIDEIQEIETQQTQQNETNEPLPRRKERDSIIQEQTIEETQNSNDKQNPSVDTKGTQVDVTPSQQSLKCIQLIRPKNLGLDMQVDNQAEHLNEKNDKQIDNVNSNVIVTPPPKQNKITKRFKRFKRIFRRKKPCSNEPEGNSIVNDRKQSRIIIIPSDCLLEIFKYFSDDLRTLYSCLLVDKHWCISTVRLIWKSPFQNECSPAVIDVYLSCLSKHEKKNLFANIKSEVIRSILTKDATFYYANFLRQLNMDNLRVAVDAWLKEHNLIERRYPDLICRALCRLFITNCENLKSLCLNWNHSKISGKWKKYPIFPYHRDASTFLHKLNELSIHRVNKRDIFLDMAKQSKHLSKLELLDYCFDNLQDHRYESIHRLIKDQYNLQHCKLFAYGLCPIVPMRGLYFQKHSLIHFELTYAKFTSENPREAFQALSACSNLKFLIIEYCYFANQNVLQPLIETIFPHLYKVQFKNLQSSAAEIFTSMIKLNSASLRELHYSDDVSRRSTTYPILDAIVTHSASSLVSLTIPFKNCQTPYLINILSFLTQLQSLKLIGSYGHERAFVDFLPELARLLPVSLRHLSLDLNWVIINTLSEFLTNLKAPLNTLYITGWSRQIRSKHVKMIERYLRQNNPELSLHGFIKDIT